MYKLDSIDKLILNETQKGLPLTTTPFLDIANNLGLNEDIVVERLNLLKEHGYIRRFGGVFDSNNLGAVSTLVGAKVDSNIEEVAKIISEYEEVTHNYQREGDYNLWFTIIANSNERIEVILNEIKEKTGVCEIVNLPAINKYKVKTYFIL